MCSWGKQQVLSWGCGGASQDCRGGRRNSVRHVGGTWTKSSQVTRSSPGVPVWMEECVQWP